MKQVYIIDYIRTPIAKFQGGLSEVRADDLAAIILKEIVKRNPQIPADSKVARLIGLLPSQLHDNEIEDENILLL
jgi:acetyl-CoA acetyltransferase